MTDSDWTPGLKFAALILVIIAVVLCAGIFDMARNHDKHEASRCTQVGRTLEVPSRYVDEICYIKQAGIWRSLR